jgi:hypothetical protein
MDRGVLVPGETARVRNFEYNEITPGYFGAASGICRAVWSFSSKVGGGGRSWRWKRNFQLERREMGSRKEKWTQKFAPTHK